MVEIQFSTEKVTSAELQRWHESNPVEELFFSQKEVARFLELGYLALRDHPEVAAEIRNTAQEARTQHVLTAGLFKKFVVTASSVVNTYCPMMMDAVELQEKDIVVEAFGQMLEMCLDMKKETEEAKNSYIAIQEKVQRNLNTVNITNTKISSEMEIIEQTKKSEQAQLEAVKQQEDELKKEVELMQEKVKKIEQNRDDWLEKTAPPTGGREVVHTVIDFAMIPTAAIIGGSLGAAPGVAVGAAIGAVATGLNFWRKKEKANQARKASHEANEYLKTTYEEEHKLSGKMFERRQQTLEKIAHIESLELKKSSFGDIKSLKEAVTQLGNVDKQFMKIIFFWDSMATMLKHLHQDQKAGGVYLKKIEDERFAGKFTLSIEKSELTWNRIGRIKKSQMNYRHC